MPRSPSPRRPAGLAPVVLPLLLAVVPLGACETPLNQPNCDVLELLVQGEVEGKSINHQSQQLDGEERFDRLVVFFPAPDRRGGVRGEWFLDFGYNTRAFLDDRQTDDVINPIQQRMAYNPNFTAVLKSDDELCDLERGEICTGLGLNYTGVRVLDPNEVAITYHPAREGRVTFSRLSDEGVVVHFRLTLVDDVERSANVVGHLEGCFRGVKTSKGTNEKGYWLR